MTLPLACPVFSILAFLPATSSHLSYLSSYRSLRFTRDFARFLGHRFDSYFRVNKQLFTVNNRQIVNVYTLFESLYTFIYTV
jgi:hypothetical protein